jgi:hypothetical protein
MDRKLFPVDFEVKREEDNGQSGNGGNNGGDGGDDDNLDNDDEADDLSDDDNPEKSKLKEAQARESAKLKTPINKTSSSSGCKTISHVESTVDVDQNRQLINLMGVSVPELLIAGGLRLLRAHRLSVLSPVP